MFLLSEEKKLFLLVLAKWFHLNSRLVSRDVIRDSASQKMPLLNLKMEINSRNFHTVLYHDYNLRSLMIDRYHDHNDHNNSNDNYLPKTHKVSRRLPNCDVRAVLH